MFPQLAKKHTLLTAYNPETSITVVDPGDVGKFAAAAILEPLDFHGYEIDLGAESLKPAELVHELSLANGKDITLEFYSQDEARRLAVNDGRLQAQLWANEVGYQVDFKELEKYQIKLTKFSQYLENHRDAVLQTSG